jgi:hypothetical protein
MDPTSTHEPCRLRGDRYQGLGAVGRAKPKLLVVIATGGGRWVLPIG